MEAHELVSPVVTLLLPPTDQTYSSCSLRQKCLFAHVIATNYFCKGPNSHGLRAMLSVCVTLLHSATVERAGIDNMEMNGHGYVLIKLYLQRQFADHVLELFKRLTPCLKI